MPQNKLDDHIEEFKTHLETTKTAFEKMWSSKIKIIVALNDFHLIQTIGTGAFGIVFAAREKKTTEISAIKLLEKKKIVEYNQVEHVKNEIKILGSIKFIFFVHLTYFFKDNVYLYLCMPLVNGGEMFTHLRRMNKFDETNAKFYAAQVVLAFQYLHNLGIIYRDLKPENILIDPDGYIKITDFGFCKKIDDSRTYTFCGTPDYVAPELILSQGYSYGVDWWGLGILIYEMCAGYPPFEDDNPLQLYEKIINGVFKCPSGFSKHLKDLLVNLIVVDKTKRYGVLKDGANDIKMHIWFKKIDWNGILTKKIRAYFKPKVRSPSDVMNFIHYEANNLRSAREDEYEHLFTDF